MKRSDFKRLAVTTLLFQCPPTFDFIGSDFRPLHALIPQVLLGNKQILPNRYVELPDRWFQLQNCASHISSTLNWNGKTLKYKHSHVHVTLEIHALAGWLSPVLGEAPKPSHHTWRFRVDSAHSNNPRTAPWCPLRQWQLNRGWLWQWQLLLQKEWNTYGTDPVVPRIPLKSYISVCSLLTRSPFFDVTVWHTQ